MRRPDERLAWALKALQRQQRAALRFFGTKLRIERKADRSPVTIADRTIEERLRRELARAFPQDAVIGEEFGATAVAPSSYWTLDPIDGTRAFSRGLPTWGMLIAYVERGRAILGVCVYPALNRLLAVGPGTPAFAMEAGRRTRLARVGPPPRLRDAVVFHGGSAWWLSSRYGRGFSRLVNDCYLERAYGDCYGFWWLFTGHADAMCEYGVKVWDMAPFAALGAATGRALVDCAGRPCFTGPEAILAHPKLAATIAKILSRRPH